MYPVTDRFKAELRKSHTVTARAEFWRGSHLIEEVPIESGEVSEDKTASVRRRCSLSIVADGNITLPTTNNYLESPLWPIGTEVKVWSGIQYRDGTTEEVPMGVFRISKPRLSRSSRDLVISIDAYDRSRTISRNRFTSPYWIVGGTDFATAMKALIVDRMPSLKVDEDFLFMLTDGSDGGAVYTTPWLVFLPQDDPWEQLLKMATSIGAELFFNGKGQCVLRPEPDPLWTPASFEYVSGETNIVDEIARDLDDEQAYNGVIVTGQTNDNYNLIPHGEAWDKNPDSPTYFDPDVPHLSVYGAVPYFYTSDYITTTEQAIAAANGMLLGVIGIMEVIEFAGLANPAHEGGDIIKVGDDVIGVDGNYLLDSWRIGLGFSGSMSGTTRKRRAA